MFQNAYNLKWRSTLLIPRPFSVEKKILKNIKNSRYSLMIMQFGQLLDHEVIQCYYDFYYYCYYYFVVIFIIFKKNIVNHIKVTHSPTERGPNDEILNCKLDKNSNLF